VALYEEDPAPVGKRFVGSAIWRTETVLPGPGRSPELAVRADIEIPERKISMTWSLRRNTDQSLPASRTVEIMFKLPAEFSSGSISNVPGILTKQSEQTRGVPLAGLAVKVTNGFFLIGLSSVDTDRERNIQLLKERSWFDIPVVYTNNRRAILALEKGNPGERAFEQAFKVWEQTSADLTYAVQVSAQKTEAEAQSSYRALQVKYPAVLGGRDASIRRVDLGEGGIFYRAEVGSFATTEQATAFCDNLKAAGGQCIGLTELDPGMRCLPSSRRAC
jgi:hypothetical protein